MRFYNIICRILCGISLLLFCAHKPAFAEVYVIDAAKNSVKHNNLGMNWFNEGYYYGAIQEFKIAISLNPDTQASASYYDNLGRSYLAIGYPELAEDCFINATRLNPMNITYRQHLANCYRRMGKAKVDEKIAEYLDSFEPLDQVNVGLLYAEKGDINSAIIKLDEFRIIHKNLILSDGVSTYLKILEKEKPSDL